ncbi:MAG: hypothetical protein RQ899_14560 [Pseudomonadales bacterium]|nr:hypothetical protein [Pseudomonadales bacterium]
MALKVTPVHLDEKTLKQVGQMAKAMDRLNWSLRYQDQIDPRLSPAYDILGTRAYIEDEQEYALNPSGTKRWSAVTMSSPHKRSLKQHWRSLQPDFRIEAK